MRRSLLNIALLATITATCRAFGTYAICGAGKVDIVEQVDPNTYKTLTKFDTALGARRA
jgi:hypothetical protein